MSVKTTLKIAVTGILLALSAPAFADMRSINAQTQASIKLAEGFYEDVLVYRNINNFGKYIGDTYTQHATAYGDGPVAVIKSIAGELTADPDVQVDVYRTIAEDDYVAIHSAWKTGSGDQYANVDIWRVEDGKLVEHWNHNQQVPAESANENTMFQGPQADIYSNQDIDQNRERAVAVLRTFENPSDTSAVENFVSAETYIQHNPYVPNGREAFLGYIRSLASEGKRFETKIAKTIAMGDFVLVHSFQTDPAVDGDLGNGYMDIFRFNDEGLIVEHWDVEEAQTGESANENDVFTYPND